MTFAPVEHILRNHDKEHLTTLSHIGIRHLEDSEKLSAMDNVKQGKWFAGYCGDTINTEFLCGLGGSKNVVFYKKKIGFVSDSISQISENVPVAIQREFLV